MRNLAEISRSDVPNPRDTVEFFLNAMADAIADRLEQRQDARRRLLDVAHCRISWHDRKRGLQSGL